MSKKKCKKCNEYFVESDGTFWTIYDNFNLNSGHVYHFNGSPYLPPNNTGIRPFQFDYSFKEKVWFCPNCGHEEFELSSIHGKDTTGETMEIGNIIVPLSKDVPENARNSFNEACKIVNLSPKASATLSRKTLELMITDFFNENSDSLFKKIDNLHKSNKINDDIYEAMTGLRLTGNLGAHESTDKIIDIKPGESQSMIDLIRLLDNEWYIARSNRKKLLNNVINTGNRIKTERKSK